VTPDVRERTDRRKAPRGGRRQHDRPGFAPLVLVADEDASTGDVCEALLATLRFAVARVDSVDKAVEVMATMLPDVIVVRGRDVSPLLRAAWPSGVPVVTVTNCLSDDSALLIEAIREAIRSAQHPRN
jgi:DNA-binding NtrC family response regulator